MGVGRGDVSMVSRAGTAVPSRERAALEHPDRLVGDRLEFGQPWSDLLALPLAFALAALLRVSWFGRLCLVPIQIQFHELGHALLAWLSARAALPLPFGFTFWREEPSAFTGSCMAFLLCVLLFYGARERRLFAVVLATVLLAVFAVLTMLVSNDTSCMFIVMAGLGGELVLSSIAIVAFYFPLPDRLRWDFFRFPVLVPAAATWLSAVAMWIGVARGTRTLPTGSILGTTGDGSGDLDRLLAQYDFSEASITAFYGRLAWLTGACLAITYGVFAWRARHTLALRARAERLRSLDARARERSLR